MSAVWSSRKLTCNSVHEKNGSAQQSVKICILRGFLGSDVFDLWVPRSPFLTKMGRIRIFAVEMTRRVNRGESQTGPSPALGNPHQTRVPTFQQRRRRRADCQRQGPTPRNSRPLTDSCTEPEK